MFTRPYYLNQLIQFKGSEFIKVITGVRHSDKSFLLRLYRDFLKKENVDDQHIIYINFEEFDSQLLTSEDRLRERLQNLIPTDGEKNLFSF